MKKTNASITKDEAVQILASALSYCQQAGLIVEGVNNGGSLILTLPGVFYSLAENGSRAILGIGTYPENIGTLPVVIASPTENISTVGSESIGTPVADIGTKREIIGKNVDGVPIHS